MANFTIEELRAEQRKRSLKGFEDTLVGVLTGFAQASTFGLGDEIAAGNNAAVRFVMSGGETNFSDDYSAFLTRERKRIALQAASSPIATVAGEGIGMAPAVAAGMVTKAPVIVESAIGMLNGFGTGEGAKNSLQSANVGAALNMFGAGTGRTVNKVVQTPMLQRITNFINTKTSKASANAVDDTFAKGLTAAERNAADAKAARKLMIDDATMATTNFVEKNPLVTGVGMKALGADTLGTGLLLKGMANRAPNALPVIGANIVNDVFGDSSMVNNVAEDLLTASPATLTEEDLVAEQTSRRIQELEAELARRK